MTRSISAADAEDVVGVALDDAVVDDVALEVGQVQVADRADEQQAEGDREVLRVGPEIGPQQPDHRSPSWAAATVASSTAGSATDRLAGGPNGPEAAEERLELVVVEPREQPDEVLATLVHHVTEDREAGLRRDHEDDPAVLVVVLALDEAALLHPADDPGRARDRHVERVGELRHRQRAARLEDGQDVEVDQAQRALQPRPEHLHPVLRAPRRHLADELGDDRVAVGRSAGALSKAPRIRSVRR